MAIMTEFVKYLASAYSNTINFEPGWKILQVAVDRVINTVKGVDNQTFTANEYMEYYTYP